MQRRLSMVIWLCLVGISLAPVSAQPKRVFIIFTPGFWGCIDKLPSQSRQWLEKSPYPHFKKHQEASFLNGENYQAIPQKYLALGKGPGFSKNFLKPYAKLVAELSYWARKVNRTENHQKIKLIQDWQTELSEVGEINLIFLKYDWRLEVPQVERDYVAPLLERIEEQWPDSQWDWVGHSLGGLVGRYVVSKHPGRFRSLISIGGPHYGIYEIGSQRRGEKIFYGNQWDLNYAQELGLKLTEQYFFGTKLVESGLNYPRTAAEFANRYTPMMRWLDPNEGLLADGFGSLPKLKEAVPHAIAFYGLGYGSYDLQGVYHPELPNGIGVGSGIEPKDNPDYAQSGDGRIDPVSAKGPFERTVCLGKELQHGELMWSPLLLTFLIDRYYYEGRMSPSQIKAVFLRRGIYWQEPIDWVLQARQAW